MSRIRKGKYRPHFAAPPLGKRNAICTSSSCLDTIAAALCCARNSRSGTMTDKSHDMENVISTDSDSTVRLTRIAFIVGSAASSIISKKAYAATEESFDSMPLHLHDNEPATPQSLRFSMDSRRQYSSSCAGRKLASSPRRIRLLRRLI